MPSVCLKCVFVVYPGHTPLPFYNIGVGVIQMAFEAGNYLLWITGMVNCTVIIEY